MCYHSISASKKYAEFQLKKLERRFFGLKEYLQDYRKEAKITNKVLFYLDDIYIAVSERITLN